MIVFVSWKNHPEKNSKTELDTILNFALDYDEKKKEKEIIKTVSKPFLFLYGWIAGGWEAHFRN